MTIRPILLLASTIVFVQVSLPLVAQEKPTPVDRETVARVEPLDRFHEVIFPMWHDAWPKRDIEKLRGLLPDIERGIAEIASADLPGILREKKGAWEEGVIALQSAGAAYRTAAAAKDTQALLGAAEILHSRYEGLSRIIRPALKELDDFHRTLYTLYHVELPAGAIEKIRVSTSVLKTKMEALNGAQLPGRLLGKLDAFVAARTSLAAALDKLESVLSTDDLPAIRGAVTIMHGKYEALSAVFD